MKQLLVADFETFYSAEYQLKKLSTEAYIRDEQFKVHGVGLKLNGGPSRWIPSRLVAPVLARIDWPNTILIGHNLHFDGSILNWRYGHVPAQYIDTLGMSRALIGQHLQRHGLGYVAAALIDTYKMDERLSGTMGKRELDDSPEGLLADYCVGLPRWNPQTQRMEAGDTELTWGIFKAMAPHFPNAEYKILDWVTRQFTQPKLYLDTFRLENYIEELIIQKDEALKAAGLTDRSLLMSNPKYAAALEDLGVLVPTKINAKGKVTYAFAKTDEAHKALLEYDAPGVSEETCNKVQALVAARLSAKSTIEQTRAVKYLDASTRGAWPVDYNYAGAKNTHRLSGAAGGGGNPTNLKRGGTLRKAIYATEGKKLLVADLAQIECRLVLWLGMQMPRANGEREALHVMATGGDLYSHFGSLMYGFTIDKHTHPLERQIAKSAVLGLGFGMGVARFIDYCRSMGIKIEPILAESAVALYRNTYSGVRQYWSVLDKVMKSAVYDGPQNIRYPVGLTCLPASEIVYDPLFQHVSIKSPSGLLLKYPDLGWDSEGQGTYRDGNNHNVKVFGGKFVENEVQHLARNILMGMLRQIDPVYPVVMSTYDELVMEIDEDAEQEATEFVTRIMTQTPKEFPGLPLGVETGCAITYGEAK